jgi:hypothetical protein
MTTYTHLGRRDQVGYRHRGRLAHHARLRRGAVHALTATGRRADFGGPLYRSACGVVVEDRSANSDLLVPPMAPVVAPDATGAGVTCDRCRQALKV